MTQPSSVVGLGVSALTLLASPVELRRRLGTVTDDGFLSNMPQRSSCAMCLEPISSFFPNYRVGSPSRAGRQESV